MTLSERYDRWLHDRVMNPTFTWIQKLFHWNRLQFILWALRGIVFGSGGQSSGFLTLGILYRSLILFVFGLWSLFIVIEEYRVLKKLAPSLKEVAQRFEECVPLRPSEDILRHAGIKRRWRVGTSARVSFLCCIMGLGWFFPPRTMTIVDILLTGGGSLFWLMVLIEAHLWDVDDIAPKDRVSLLEPKTVRDTV